MSVILKPAILKKLLSSKWDDEPKVVKGWEGWELTSDTSSGDFDAEKGAMCNYKLTLTDPEGNIYIGHGGYYTAITGEVFSYDVVFEPKKKRKPSKKFDDYKLYLKLKKKYG